MGHGLFIPRIIYHECKRDTIWRFSVHNIYKHDVLFSLVWSPWWAINSFEVKIDVQKGLTLSVYSARRSNGEAIRRREWEPFKSEEPVTGSQGSESNGEEKTKNTRVSARKRTRGYRHKTTKTERRPGGGRRMKTAACRVGEKTCHITPQPGTYGGKGVKDSTKTARRRV